MKRTIVGILSLLPGSVFALESATPKSLRITATSSNNVLRTVGVIQAVSLGLGKNKVSLTLDTTNNSIDVNVRHEQTATELAKKLKLELGDDVIVEQFDPRAMSHGSQDNFMAP